jgi:protein-tyrosine-phosphatase
MATKPIVFVCTHGGAKSVMAAAWFRQLAEERGLSFDAIAAAAEDPYAAVPEPVAALLEREGRDVRAFQPRRIDADDLRGAARVVTIGCELPELGPSSAAFERWDDVPQPGEDLDGAEAAIRRRVAALVEELGERD